MKFRTVVIAAGAGAVGYLLGTKAGRAQFEQIKARANELAHDPRVQSGVSTVAGEVRKNAHVLPDPVAGVVRTAAEKVETATKSSTSPVSDDPLTTPGTTTPGVTDLGDTTPGTTTFGTPGTTS